MENKPTRILLVDDHQIIIDGIRLLVEEEQDVVIAQQALDGLTALQILAETPIDLVILDINLPDKNGFEICQQIKTQFPHIKVITLTMHGESGYIRKMAKMGVDGYILKNAGKAEMLRAIRSVMGGQSYFSQEVTNNLIAGLQPSKKIRHGDFIQKLTRREKEVLQLITEELTTEEIAEKLFISPTTVITHRKNLLRKLNAKNTAGLVKHAIQFGLIQE